MLRKQGCLASSVSKHPPRLECNGCSKSCVLQVPLRNSELATQPVKTGTVLLKSALAWIWLEKGASPFLLGMENIFPEHRFSAWASGCGLKSCLFFPGWLSTFVYG